MKEGGEGELFLWRRKKKQLTEDLGLDLFADTALDVLIDIALSSQNGSASMDRLQDSTGLSTPVLARYIATFEKRDLVECSQTNESIEVTNRAKRLLGL